MSITDDESAISHSRNAVFIAIPLDDIEAAAAVLNGTKETTDDDDDDGDDAATTIISEPTTPNCRASRRRCHRLKEKDVGRMIWVMLGAAVVIAFLPFFCLEILRLPFVLRLFYSDDNIMMLGTSISQIRITRSTEQAADFSTELTEDNFHQFLRDNDNAFVNFCSPHCVWCQRLEPSWEMFAQLMVQQSGMAVGVGRVDCKIHSELCQSENSIMEHPTLRWFHRGVAQMPDYKMDRSVQGLIDFAYMKVNEKRNDSVLLSTSPEHHQLHEDEDEEDRNVANDRLVDSSPDGDHGSDHVGYYYNHHEEKYDSRYRNIIQPRRHSYHYDHHHHHHALTTSDFSAYSAPEDRHSSDVGHEDSQKTSYAYYSENRNQDTIKTLEDDDNMNVLINPLEHDEKSKEDVIEHIDVLEGFVKKES